MHLLRFQNETTFGGCVVEQQTVQLSEFLTLQCKVFVKGWVFFWNHVDASMIDALYSSTKPTSSRLIKSLCVSEQCAKDQKLTTWLHRFIRSCTNGRLGSLIRFVTGMTNLMPDAKIKVEYVNQRPGNIRPLSQTCFRILLLPRQYASFYEMKTNVTTYLRSEDSCQVNDNL